MFEHDPVPLSDAQNSQIKALISESTWLGVRGVKNTMVVTPGNPPTKHIGTSWYHEYLTKLIQPIYSLQSFFTLPYVNWQVDDSGKVLHFLIFFTLCQAREPM